MGLGWDNTTSSWSGFNILGWLVMFLFWLLLILAVVALVRYLSGSGPGKRSEKEKTPLDILKERYASGEISKEEFAEKRKDLRV